MPETKLLRQAFVESQGARFTTAVVGHFADTQKTARTGDGHNMAVVTLNHGRQKLAHCPPMCERVDFEDFSNHRFGLLKNQAFLTDTSVVDEDGRVAVVSPNTVGGFLDAGRRCDVAFVEVGIPSYITVSRYPPRLRINSS